MQYTIYHAAAADDVASVAEFIRRGGDVNLPEDGDGWTPLHFAAYTGNLRLAMLLVNSGADVNKRCPKAGYPPLHLAVQWRNWSVVELLVKRGADLASRDSSGKTALAISIAYKHDDITTLLRKHGAKE
jgi:ankyrin repeat protein